MYDNSSHCSIKIFQFARYYGISLIGFPVHATLLLQPRNVRIFEPQANVYFLELDKSHQAENTNINGGDLLALFKHSSEKAETKKNFNSNFQETGICAMNAECVVKHVAFGELVFIGPVRASDPH